MTTVGLYFNLNKMCDDLGLENESIICEEAKSERKTQ